MWALVPDEVRPDELAVICSGFDPHGAAPRPDRTAKRLGEDPQDAPEQTTKAKAFLVLAVTAGKDGASTQERAGVSLLQLPVRLQERDHHLGGYGVMQLGRDEAPLCRVELVQLAGTKG